MSDEMKQQILRTMKAVIRIEERLDRMENHMATGMASKKDIEALNGRMDGFSGLLLDSRHRWAVHAETLAQHDARLKKLEFPSS